MGFFTLSEAYIVSFICSNNDKTLVTLAVLMTFGITSALTVYAMTT